MASSNISKLQNAMTTPMDYPRNLKSLNGLNHRTSLEGQLLKRSENLFYDESSGSRAATTPAVEFLDLNNAGGEYKSTPIHNVGKLREHLKERHASHNDEPIQRLMFIHAPNARKPLNITKEMFLQILTWHNVMPSFLEFVFPFGKQIGTRDSLLMGFRSESRIYKGSRRFPIHDLGRSGRHLELCYSLKSVERTEKETMDPAKDWSVRQCSIHHSFDLETDQSTWIVIKGNKRISDSFRARVAVDLDNDPTSNETQPSLFAISLDLHRILAAWSSDNWHWYISDLERCVKEHTDGALSASFNVELFPSVGTLANDPPPVQMPKRQSTWQSVKRVVTWPARRRDISAKNIKAAIKWLTGHRASPGLPTQESSSEIELSPTIPEATGFDEFSFRDLQNVQFVEERANEMATILQANSRVLGDLVREYNDLKACLQVEKEFSDKQRDSWGPAISAFQRSVEGVDQDIVVQRARVDSLLRLVADRKNLLNGVLQYRSMEASRLYAQRAQNSAARMERMTREMRIIAEKTKKDTVSMKIITWVTLFFLPGTFISTLMSTPIVRFNKNKPDFSGHNIGYGALKLYLAISLPLVLITLLAWWAVSVRENYKDKTQREKMKTDREKLEQYNG